MKHDKRVFLRTRRNIKTMLRIYNIHFLCDLSAIQFLSHAISTVGDRLECIFQIEKIPILLIRWATIWDAAPTMFTLVVTIHDNRGPLEKSPILAIFTTSVNQAQGTVA